MSALSCHRPGDQANPIDLLEELAAANGWRGERTADHEMAVALNGNWCDYRMLFAWNAELGSVYFSCLFDLRIPARKRPAALELLALINERLWLGHFELCGDDLVPMYRHTLLVRGPGGASVEQLEELVDIAQTECERFYPAFQFVLWGGHGPRAALDAAMLETVGEA
ncbi:MAG: YbjN domain-containing protein [Dongiaceae bacterium]